MEKLVHTGLVKRISGKYRITCFGKVIFSIYLKIVEPAVKYHRGLKAIESITLKSAEAKELPLEERQRIIDNLLDNQHIKDILASSGI